MSEKQGGAGGGTITLEMLREKINEVLELCNGTADAIQSVNQKLGAMDNRLGAAEQRIQQIVTQPAGPGLGVDIHKLLERIEALELRPSGPMNPQQAQAAAQAAMAREAKMHAGDRMMYHSDPKHHRVARVVTSDAEAKAAAREGYHLELREAAQAGLPKEIAESKDTQAREQAILARMEELKRAVIRPAA